MGVVDDPITLLFGDFIIFGGLSLNSTNIDLGPQSYRVILMYFALYWPIILLVVVFVVGFVVYRRVTKRSKARRNR
jgi:heme/copper-type cytochrome/quinol oxidase subunit 2